MLSRKWTPQVEIDNVNETNSVMGKIVTFYSNLNVPKGAINQYLENIVVSEIEYND